MKQEIWQQKKWAFSDTTNGGKGDSRLRKGFNLTISIIFSAFYVLIFSLPNLTDTAKPYNYNKDMYSTNHSGEDERRRQKNNPKRHRGSSAGTSATATAATGTLLIAVTATLLSMISSGC